MTTSIGGSPEMQRKHSVYCKAREGGKCGAGAEIVRLGDLAQVG
jgi:hypothetical protein